MQMFSLVKFANGEVGVYPSSKIKAHKDSEVIVQHNGKGRYTAKLLCTEDNEQMLKKLKDDVMHNRLQVLLFHISKPKEKFTSVKKCLFEDSQCNPSDDINFGSGLFDNSLKDYDIIEKIYDGRYETSGENAGSHPSAQLDENYDFNDDIDLYRAESSSSAHLCDSDSDSDWLPDEEQEEEHWNGLTAQLIDKPGLEGGKKINILGDQVLNSDNQLSQEGAAIIIEDNREIDDPSREGWVDPIILSVSASPEIEQPIKKKAALKKHSCLFCGNLVINLPRHMRARHANEESVKAAIELSEKYLTDAQAKHSKCRSHTAFEELRKSGDYQHNKKSDVENLITVRNSSKANETVFVSCPLCQGYFSKKSFKFHFKHCNMRIEKKDVLNSIGNIIGEARVNGKSINKNATPELVKHFFPYFTKPAQADILFTDDTAVAYGNKLVSKYFRTNAGGKNHIYIASQLRLLADMLINAQFLDPKIKKIEELVDPKEYDLLIRAIQLRCGYDSGKYKSPTTATNCCTLMLKVTRFLKCQAIKRSNDIAEKQYANFEYLLSHSQNHDITRQAQDNKMIHQRQKKEILPSTDEINCLLRTLDFEVNTAYERAFSEFNEETYTILSKATLAYLLVFNRKRPGDVEKTQLLEISSMVRLGEEYLDKLPENDRQHAEQFARYITQGKLNKRISNLIPKTAARSINLIIERRHEIGIKENQYLFAHVGGSNRLPYFQADEALRNICNKNNLDYRKLNANKLRKHLATCTGMMPPEKQNIISDFMGHTMAIHKNVYQQKEAHTDILVMGKVLLEASGLSANNNISSNSTNLNESVEAINQPNLLPTLYEDREYINTSRNNSENISNKRKIAKNCLRRKKTWITPEKKTVRSLFEHFLKNFEVPSIHQIQEILNVNEECKINRNATHVRSWLIAEISRMKKNHKGIPVQRWTTPQRQKIRSHFKTYFEMYKKNFVRNYPSREELRMATETIPEFQNKSAATLRSKIQHEFCNIDGRLEEVLTDSADSSDSC